MRGYGCYYPGANCGGCPEWGGCPRTKNLRCPGCEELIDDCECTEEELEAVQKMQPCEWCGRVGINCVCDEYDGEEAMEREERRIERLEMLDRSEREMEQ